MRYFVRAANGEALAVLGFAAAAWKTAPRDEFIGWSPAVRQRNLALVVNNARFLGTCYQSANWLCVGQTQGRGKLDVHRQSALPVKSVRLKPLQKNWRTILCR